MRYSNTTVRELKSRYKQVLLKCAFLNAALLIGISVSTIAKADAPITDRPVFVVGDLSLQNQYVATGQAAFAGRRMDKWGNGKYQNDFPKYQMVGRSFSITDSDIYVGPVTLTLRELTDNDKFSFNYQIHEVDRDLAKDANVQWNETKETVNTKVSAVIGSENAAYTAPVVYEFSQLDNTKKAGLLSFSGTSAIIDGATINANAIIVTNSNIIFSKQDKSKLTAFLDSVIDSDGKTTLNANTIDISGSTLKVNKNSELSFQGNLTLNGSINNEGTVNFVNGSTLKAALNGSTVIAGASGIITGETALVLTEVSEGAAIVFEGNKDAFKFSENALYDITLSGNKYSITKKSTDTIAETVASSGATEQEATAVAAIAGTTSTDETVNAVLNEISTAIQEGNAQKAAAIVKAVNPEVAPVSRVAAASNAVLGAVATRMSALGGAPAPAPTAAARGRSGGDVTVKLSPWVQGLYNKTHNSQGDGFNAYTQGFAFGADVDLTDAWTLGIGYAYTATDVKSDRKTQIYGDNVFAYAQYKPENWYVNAVASYGKSNYKQDSTFSAEYDANAYSGQLLTGYDAGVFDTYTGIRYNYIKTDAYNNGIANIKSKNSQIGTFVLGTRISQDFQVKKGFFLTPEFRLAGTYDFKSDNTVSTVGIIGSTASYTITGDRMSRGAIEAGIGLTTSVNNFELKFDYDAALRSENNTQAVNLKAIYHF